MIFSSFYKLNNQIKKLIIIFNLQEAQMKAPIYIVKPKNIFRHPFNKFDLDKPMNRDTQNDDITDYFNYGFNEDTMVIYSKLVKRTLEVLQQSVNPTYFDAPSELMRLNDQIPMDFGGFCKFFDTSIFLNPEATQQELKYMIDYHNGQRIFEFFIYIATSKNRHIQYPLIEFVRVMYKNYSESESFEMRDAMDQIQQNLERKYQETMKKLIEKKNNPGGTNGTAANAHNQKQQGTKQKKTNQASSSGILKQLAKNNKKQQDNLKKQQSESGSQSSSDDSSDSSSQSDDSRQRKKNKRRSKSESKSKRDKKNKNKKIRKQDKRSREREREKDRRDKDKRKQKSRKKSKEREREKQRQRQRDRDRQRKQKSKKRRN